jgi:hypothetical protein
VEVTTWREFEQFVTALAADARPEAVVRHNVITTDANGVQHQIDVDIEWQWQGRVVRMMLDCKLLKSKVQKGDVQKLAKTRDALGYDLGGVVAARVDGFTVYAKRQAEVDDIALFDLSHWLVVKVTGGEFGVTGSRPMTEDFVAGTRAWEGGVVSEAPAIDVDGRQIPSWDWLLPDGAMLRDLLERWQQEGHVAHWRDEAIGATLADAEQLPRGEWCQRKHRWPYDPPVLVHHPSGVDQGTALLLGWEAVVRVRWLAADAITTEWFLRTLQQGTWEMLLKLVETRSG